MIPLPTPTIDDQELLRRVASGDRHAFATFYERYGGRIAAYLSSLGAAKTDVDDLLQDVFLAVWDRATTFDARRGVAAGWLFTIARNKWFDRLRYQGRRPTSALESEPIQPPLRLSLETRLAVVQALGQLDDGQRSALELAYFGGLTYEETARRLELPLGTLKSRVRSGLNRLRQHLENR